MDTEKMVLGFLMSGPKTGYKIKNITGKLMMAYNLSLNQIYPVLRKLESNGMIKKDVVFQIGKPNKNVYTITPEGRSAFFKSITAPPMPIDYTFDFLTKMFFFRFLSREEVIKEFEKEIGSLEEQLEELDERRPDVDMEDDEDGKFIYETIVHVIETLMNRYEEEMVKRRKKLVEAGQ